MTFLKRGCADGAFAWVTFSSNCLFELQLQWIRASPQSVWVS